MIVVKLMDGLGNQMFQYAFARYLQSRYNEKIIFETSKLGKKAARLYGLDKLSLNSNVRLANKFENIILKLYSKIIRVICEKVFKISFNSNIGYYKMIKIGLYTTEEPIKFFEFRYSKLPIKIVRGYFQSPKYFEQIENIIKQEFRVSTYCNEESEAFIRQLNNSESVCVHIRRGDYIGNEKFEICNEKYYRDAIKYCLEKLQNPRFYIFSNCPSDLKWIKDNFNLPGNKVYVDIGQNEFDDLRFMYNCKHFIISNSTFSWWASYLAENINKITVAPSRWYNSNEDTRDIYCSDWKLIQV